MKKTFTMAAFILFAATAAAAERWPVSTTSFSSTESIGVYKFPTFPTFPKFPKNNNMDRWPGSNTALTFTTFPKFPKNDSLCRWPESISASAFHAFPKLIVNGNLERWPDNDQNHTFSNKEKPVKYHPAEK